MTEWKITTPLSDEDVAQLRVGDQVFITGIIFTGRDAAHKKLIELVHQKKPLPFDLKGQIIYYVGPTPARPGKPIGSAGPTTSYRMDSYAPLLYSLGLKATIGKGARSEEVKEALRKNKAVYLAAVGGAGALISKSIVKSEVVAYPELGPEAIRKMEVKDFPAVVVNDMYGGDLYLEGKKKYQI
ncbi:MAG: Fe-S-containing hydro-lyase [Candidatus Aminicenantia bacterium]